MEIKGQSSEAEKTQEEKNEEIKEMGTVDLEEGDGQGGDPHRIKLITIIGEIEGHEAVSGNTKATKYEHLLPMLAEIEDSPGIDGLLILLNTLGGDVEAGLSIAEVIASLSKPTDHDHPSGAQQRHVHRCHAEFPKYGEDAGSDHRISGQALPHEPGADRGADAQFHSACEGCGDSPGGGGGCTRRPYRRGGGTFRRTGEIA